MNSFCICYALVDHQIEGVPLLPEAYIVELYDTALGYIQKQALPETLAHFNIHYKDTPEEQLIQICIDVKPVTLTQQFQLQKTRKKQPLSVLLQNKKNAKLITAYIDKKLATFYDILRKHQYPLCMDVHRDHPVDRFRISYANTSLLPVVTFTKTNEGITYGFSLKDEDQSFIPKAHHIQLVLNTPAWLILDQKLYALQHLNANKIKPFLTKESISIAEKHVKMYLEKMILPVIKKVEVIAHGFEIHTNQTLTTYTFEIIYDFMSHRYLGQLSLEYSGVLFQYTEKKTNSATLDFTASDSIQIVQTKRNTNEEAKIVSLLCDKGLHLNSNLLFEFASEDPYGIFDWYEIHREQLSNEGFDITLPKYQSKTILTAPATLTFNHHNYNDWLDLKGTITVGTHTIPFSALLPNIREGNRFFEIDTDTVFILPLVWMTTYKKLAHFGKTTAEKTLRVTKSNYTLLQEILPEESLILETKTSPTYIPSTELKATLRPYQTEGVQWILNHLHNGLGACLADDMGLGKTLQTLAVLTYAKTQLTPENTTTTPIKLDLFSDPLEVKTYLKALIILPSSLVFNWAKEILKFTPHFNCVQYIGHERKKLLPYLASYDIILSTYTTITRDYKQLQKSSFRYLIIDESQYIKNKNSKLFDAINSLHTQHKISLSGTPIENSLTDLWSQMEFINPGILGSYHFFKNHFKIPIEKHQNEERIIALKTLVAPFILRRTKENVVKDLPELTEHVMYTTMLPEQEKKYESEKSAARNALLNIGTQQNKIHIINTLMKLRQWANHPKLIDKHTVIPSGKFIDVTHYLKTLTNARKKVLVFSSFVSHLELYQQWCDENAITYTTLTGQTSQASREKAVSDFQNDERISIFFISLKAGGVGLNLTKASYIVLLDPWWNPFTEKQAIARAHRIGQSQNVMVTRFITKNSIEEKILQLQEKKKLLSEDIMDTNNTIEEHIQELESILT